MTQAALGNVRALYRYPVKSCGGTTHDAVAIERRGVRWDRRWMAVDMDGQALTARTVPGLSRLAASVDDAGARLTIAGDGEASCVVAAGDVASGGAPRAVTVWGDRVIATDAGDDAARWLSERLRLPCRLVFMPEEPCRPVDPAYSQPGDTVSFADGYPLLLTLTASLGDLNRRLDEPVGWDRFRPNVVIDGFDPFAEDSWRRVAIGAMVFRVAKPCARCVMVTLDPATGRFGKEPLRTLAGFRRREGKVYFGQNLIPEGEGVVRVGDAVRVVA